MRRRRCSGSSQLRPSAGWVRPISSARWRWHRSCSIACSGCSCSLRFATTALTAQALGAGDVAEQRTTLIRALLLAAAIGLALIALQVAARQRHFSSHGREPRSHARGRALFPRPHLVGAVRACQRGPAWLADRACAREHRIGPASAGQCGEPRGDRVAGAVHRARRHRGGLRGRGRGGDRHDRRPHRRVSSGRHTPARNCEHPRSRAAHAPVPDQSRHLHPDRRADRRVGILHRAERARRRCRAGGEFGAAQPDAGRRVLSRRLCRSVAAALRAGGRRAR